ASFAAPYRWTEFGALHRGRSRNSAYASTFACPMTPPRFLLPVLALLLSRSTPVLALAALAVAGSPAARGQPSGGPYGPIQQRYELPEARQIHYVAPDGRADADGSTLERPTTLAAAIARVVTGDAIILRGGTYRTG